MEFARIAVIEDNPVIRHVLDIAAEHEGHTIVASAENLRQAMDLLGKIATQEIDVDVIFIDNQLPSGEPPNRLDAFAVALTAEIERLAISAWVIGFSSERLPAEASVHHQAVGKDIDSAFNYIRAL